MRRKEILCLIKANKIRGHFLLDCLNVLLYIVVIVVAFGMAG